MKKHFLSTVLALILLISSFPAYAEASQPVIGASFASAEITVGDIDATVAVANTDKEITFTLAYYRSDNTLVKCTSETFSVPEGQIGASFPISLTTPDDVLNGDYAKIMAYDKSTLEPFAVSAGTSVIFCNNTRVDSYKGLSERFYTLDSPDGSLCVEVYTEEGDTGKLVTKRRVVISSEGTSFRLKDMCDGEYSFEDSSVPRFRLECGDGGSVKVNYYSAGSASQRWILEEYNDGYALLSANGGYLAIKNGSPVVQDEKYEWQLTFRKESPFTLLTALDGFKLLSDSEQQRVIDICTSIGADALPFAPNSDSFLDKCEKTFSVILTGNYTPEEQKNMILTAISSKVTGQLAESGVYYSLSSFPGGDATITQSNPVKTKHIMWDLVEENGVIYSASTDHPYTGEAINCYCITVTYQTSDSEQTVNVYCVDPEFSNVQTAISALGKFPYAYRKNIKNLYVYRSSTTSTYNCGGEELFVRLTTTASETSMIKSFAHELGHSNDYMANGDVNNRSSHWSQGDKWTQAVNNDIVTVSTYGNSNSDEGFAEFARLYWLCYGNRDLEIGIKQLFPNRFASFQRMLKKIGCDDAILY